MQPSWKEYLLRQARLNSMCLENIEGIQACESKADAIALYKKTVDWALERRYPQINFIRNEFGDFEDLGLFVDKTFHGELLNAHQCYVFHNCQGNIEVDLNSSERIIPMLYFANGCNMTITRADKESAFPITVPLYIFHENNIVAEDCDSIKFRIYKKGGVE